MGDCDAQQYNQIMDEFLEQCGITPSDANGQEKSPAERMDELRKMMKDVLVIDESMLEEIPDVPSDSEIDWFKSVKNEDEDKWDCETVLSKNLLFLVVHLVSCLLLQRPTPIQKIIHQELAFPADLELSFLTKLGFLWGH